jgi:hypothetical protein
MQIKTGNSSENLYTDWPDYTLELANVFHQHTLQPKTNVLDSQIK